MRTTKAEVESVFKLWVSGVNGRVAKSYNDVGAYQLDNNPAYGGYCIHRISNVHGGVSDFMTTRLSAYYFVTALRVSMRSIEELRLNEKGLL